MSRIGKNPIPVPQGAQVKIEGNTVTVTGPKGTLTKTFLDSVNIALEESNVIVTRKSEDARNVHGLTRTLINNMVIGVTEGFSKTLEISGVGYKAQKQGNKLVLSLGYSHPVEFEETAELTIEVPTATSIIIKGIDKEAVGQLAANIREMRLPEPYKGKGIKYAGEKIKRKEGKAGGKK